MYTSCHINLFRKRTQFSCSQSVERSSGCHVPKSNNSTKSSAVMSKFVTSIFVVVIEFPWMCNRSCHSVLLVLQEHVVWVKQTLGCSAPFCANDILYLRVQMNDGWTLRFLRGEGFHQLVHELTSVNCWPNHTLSWDRGPVSKHPVSRINQVPLTVLVFLITGLKKKNLEESRSLKVLCTCCVRFVYGATLC